MAPSSLFSLIFITYYVSLASSQVSRGNFNHNEQDRLRCLGVQCPSERPRCITENRITKCVPIQPVRITFDSRNTNNRLSRRPIGLLSSINPTPISLPFKLNEAEKLPSHQQFIQLPSSQNSMQNPTATAGSSEKVPSFCYEKFQTGNCFAYFPRYYYNQETRRCHRFIYGGCGGNRNNFKTEHACKSICLEPILNSGFDVGLDARQPGRQISGLEARQPIHHVPGSSPNSATDNVAIPPSPHGTTGFAKGAPPPPSLICQDEPERGPCFALIPRYYYNKDTKQCRLFRYGGCGGNRNNFRSLASCKQACDYFDFYTSRQSKGNNIPQDRTADILPNNIPEFNEKQAPITTATPKATQSLRPDFCLLPKKVGPCRALIPRFFFNSETKRCEQFGFGGCQPNKNNFRSERQCKRQCAPQKITGINTISRGGNIIGERNTMPRGQLRQFNPIDSAAFREFLISQQMNNDIDMIGPSVPGFYVCAQPLDPGTCTLEIRSYYFNGRTRSCQPFIFHGCGGNQNRFPTLKSCQDMCMIDRNSRPVATP